MMAVMMMMVVVVEEIMTMVTVVAEVGGCGGEDEMVGMVVIYIYIFFWCQIGYSLEVLTCRNSKNILQSSPCTNIAYFSGTEGLSHTRHTRLTSYEALRDVQLRAVTVSIFLKGNRLDADGGAQDRVCV